MKLMKLQWSFIKSILLSTKVRVIWNLDWLTQIDSKHSSASIDSSNKAEMKDECSSSLMQSCLQMTCTVPAQKETSHKGKWGCPLTPPIFPSSASIQPGGAWSPHSFSQGLFSPCPCLSFPCLCSLYLLLFSHPYLKICHLSPSEVALPTHFWAAAFRFGWQPAPVFWYWNAAWGAPFHPLRAVYRSWSLMKLPLEAAYLEEKEHKPVKVRGFSLVVITELLGSVLSPPLVKHHTSAPHLDISKADREAIDLRGGWQPALVISRWRRESPRIPTFQQNCTWNAFFADLLARSDSDCLNFLSIISCLQSQLLGLQKWNSRATGSVISDRLDLWIWPAQKPSVCICWSSAEDLRMGLMKEPAPKKHITGLYFKKQQKPNNTHLYRELVVNEPGIQIMLKKKYLPLIFMF